MNIEQIDSKIIASLGKIFLPAARVAIFLVYFWFGILKIFDLSPASGLAESLISISGISGFSNLFIFLGILECLIGLLFLLPKTTRIVIPLLFVHLLLVCSPLILLPELTWSSFLVPTLEGQYIIKNVVLAALAIGIAAQTTPFEKHG